MIVVVCVALLASIFSGQIVNAGYGFYNPEIWTKFPIGVLKEHLARHKFIQSFSAGDSSFQCLDESAEKWQDDIKSCIVEVRQKTSAHFVESGPRGEKLKGPGDMDPKYGLCVLDHLVTSCFFNRRVYDSCNFYSAFLMLTLREITRSMQPAILLESCRSGPEDKEEWKRMKLKLNYTSGYVSGTQNVPVRRRLITETPAEVRQCLDSNEEYFQNKLNSCNNYENRIQTMDEDYELCLSYGLQSHCLAAAVEERCGLEGVGSAIERVRSEMPFDIWASCTVHPAFVFTESPPGVKFLNQPQNIFTLAVKTQDVA